MTATSNSFTRVKELFPPDSALHLLGVQIARTVIPLVGRSAAA